MKNKKRKSAGWLGITGIFIILILLSSCKGVQITTEPTTQPKPELAPPPTEEEMEGKETQLAWTYDPTGKKDPFKIPMIERPPPPFCTFGYYLDQMWIDAIIIGGGGNNIAHLLLPNQKDCFVKVGDIVGVNKGVVKEIKPDGIVVEEQFLDIRDPTKIRIVEKFLKMETETSFKK